MVASSRPDPSPPGNFQPDFRHPNPSHLRALHSKIPPKLCSRAAAAVTSRPDRRTYVRPTHRTGHSDSHATDSRGTHRLGKRSISALKPSLPASAPPRFRPVECPRLLPDRQVQRSPLKSTPRTDRTLLLGVIPLRFSSAVSSPAKLVRVKKTTRIALLAGRPILTLPQRYRGRPVSPYLLNLRQPISRRLLVPVSPMLPKFPAVNGTVLYPRYTSLYPVHTRFSLPPARYGARPVTPRWYPTGANTAALTPRSAGVGLVFLLYCLVAHNAATPPDPVRVGGVV